MTRRIAVLISGRGSNLQALIDAVADGRLDATIAVVISNRPDAQGLERARAAGIPTATINHREYPTREAFEDVLVAELRAREVSLICLAGFMRLLGRTFLDARTASQHPPVAALSFLDARRRWDHAARRRCHGPPRRASGRRTDHPAPAIAVRRRGHAGHGLRRGSEKSTVIRSRGPCCRWMTIDGRRFRPRPAPQTRIVPLHDRVNGSSAAPPFRG